MSGQSTSHTVSTDNQCKVIAGRKEGEAPPAPIKPGQKWSRALHGHVNPSPAWPWGGRSWARGNGVLRCESRGRFPLWAQVRQAGAWLLTSEPPKALQCLLLLSRPASELPGAVRWWRRVLQGQHSLGKFPGNAPDSARISPAAPLEGGCSLGTVSSPGCTGTVSTA